MAKAGRGQTRQDSKRRVLRPGESVRADGKYQYKYHIDGNHILSIVGNWNLRTNFQKARNHAFPFESWKTRFGYACKYRGRTDDCL